VKECYKIGYMYMYIYEYIKDNIKALSNLCILGPSQIVIPFETLWSHFLLSFTVLNIVWNVTTIISLLLHFSGTH
jgi:hypothetical protein